jgi:hypothetical protein
METLESLTAKLVALGMSQSAALDFIKQARSLSDDVALEKLRRAQRNARYYAKRKTRQQEPPPLLLLDDEEPENVVDAEGTGRGRRLHKDWQPTERDVQYAEAKGLSAAQIAHMAEDFLDYWTARAGAKATKRDWAATWRRWVRSNSSKGGGTNGHAPRNGGPRPSGFAAEAMNSILALQEDDCELHRTDDDAQGSLTLDASEYYSRH